jgi:hypothetical protein
MQRFCKAITLAAGLWLASVGTAYAELDAFTASARDSFRETIAAYSVQTTDTSIEEQAKYLMLVKNGLSLYRDGALEAEDKSALGTLVDQQVKASNAALGSPLAAEQKALVRQMHTAALAAKQLLDLEPTTQGYSGLMDNYQAGVGYDAYRSAQDIGIEQY